jgi:CRP/FNR family transcriptional regulator, anaerobic regulatory protein
MKDHVRAAARALLAEATMLLELDFPRQEGPSPAPQETSGGAHSRTLPSSAKEGCASCSLRSACVPDGLTAQEIARFDAIVNTTRTIKRGEALYRTHDPFESIYAVRAGSFKTVVMHRDGREQVTGFHLAGEVLGLDGVCAERHSSDAIALEDSSVCIMPYSLLESMCTESKQLQRQMLRTMSSEIVRESSLMLLLGTVSAEQRVATFLLNLSSRMKARGYSAAEFNLRMTREEMGNYLGMKLETVSRMFSKFQRDGLLETHGKKIRIVDLTALEAV